MGGVGVGSIFGWVGDLVKMFEDTMLVDTKIIGKVGDIIVDI